MNKKISAAIIAQDEEDYIERAVLNVKDHVDEIIIVDGGSTDKTISICESHGCKVYHRPFDLHFANQRNYALSLCTNEWVLTLDADEYYSEYSLASLPNLIDLNNNAAVYMFTMIHQIEHADNLETVDITKSARLVNKNRGSWVNRIHEVFVPHNGFTSVELSNEHSINNKKTVNRQLYNNFLYRNIESNILERPAYNLGLKGLGTIDYNNKYTIVQNSRNNTK
jgi:glycosyltransferase involved in cell wall biosynthesis